MACVSQFCRHKNFIHSGRFIEIVKAVEKTMNSKQRESMFVLTDQDFDIFAHELFHPLETTTTDVTGRFDYGDFVICKKSFRGKYVKRRFHT